MALHSELGSVMIYPAVLYKSASVLPASLAESGVLNCVAPASPFVAIQSAVNPCPQAPNQAVQRHASMYH